MWKYEYRQNAQVDQQKIWNLYADVNQWILWDDSIASVAIDGPFVTGTMGAVHNTDLSSTPYLLRDVKDEKSYTMVTKIQPLGLEIAFGHTIVPLDIGRYTIVHTLEIEGVNADQIGYQIGPELTKDFKIAVDNLIKAAGGTNL